MTDDQVDVEVELRCVECGAVATGRADGWRAYRVDLEEEDEPEVAFYCRACAKREFGVTPSGRGST
jgi:ribosomal protein L44E